jgi:hypothetical protein
MTTQANAEAIHTAIQPQRCTTTNPPSARRPATHGKSCALRNQAAVETNIEGRKPIEWRHRAEGLDLMMDKGHAATFAAIALQAGGTPAYLYVRLAIR